MNSTETFIDGWDGISKDVDYAGWPCNRMNLNPIRL